MSYRCQVCRAIVPAGQPKMTHLIKRPDGQIARELAVCQYCHEALNTGSTLKSLLPGNNRPEVPQVVAPLPPKPVATVPLVRPLTRGASEHASDQGAKEGKEGQLQPQASDGGGTTTAG